MSLRLMYSPILLRSIAQVLLLQDLESGDTTKKWEETLPWLEFDENLQGALCKLCKKGGRSLQRTGGTWITKQIELEKKDPLSASFKMLESSKDYKIGR